MSATCCLEAVANSTDFSLSSAFTWLAAFIRELIGFISEIYHTGFVLLICYSYVTVGLIPESRERGVGVRLCQPNVLAQGPLAYSLETLK